MKKGIAAAIIGVAFVFLAMIFISFSEGGFLMMWMVIPFIFFVVIAMLFTGIVKKAQEAQKNEHYHSQENYEGEGNLKECIECHAMMDKDFEYCPKCGASQKDKVICPYCGTENDEMNSICVNCRRFL
ncbi:MAG TPA: zinc ribbon domain-containing protein [Bacillota bacterium]|nr:zinc ribbon domain-containing protein [Bacillota bacterium]